MMAESGAADQIALTLASRAFGEKRTPWAMLVIGLLVGLPAFFEVGFVLLVPILFTVARRTKTSLVLLGLPMVAGLSVVHGLVPPHPAAMMAVTIYKADVGRTIFYALLIGIPVAVIAGPVYARLIAPHVSLPVENAIAIELSTHTIRSGSFQVSWLSVLTIVLPVVLMLIVGSFANMFTVPGSAVNDALHLAGNDDIALLIGVLFSMITLGTLQGFSARNCASVQH